MSLHFQASLAWLAKAPRLFCWLPLANLLRIALGAAWLCSGLLGRAEIPNLDATLRRAGYGCIELRRTGENHLFLFGKVNGRKRSCLVDTGWSRLTVSSRAAARFASSGLISELRLGSLLFTNVPALVQELSAAGKPAPFDVVIGCDFLIRHRAILDCANHRLYVLAAPATPQASLALEGLGLVEVPLRQREPLALTCATRLNETAIEMLVDTGAMLTCLDAMVAKAIGIDATPSVNRISGFAGSGPRKFAVAEPKRFSVGDVRQGATGIAVLSLADWGLGPEGHHLKQVGGVLGGGELARAHAVIDCGRSILWVRPAR